jgi:uncharacterized protein
MEFGCDETKCESNLAKRGLDFADVFPTFLDPTKIIVEDIRSDYGEVRYNMLAKLHGRICNITFTKRQEIVWLISARKANQREQTRYGKL